ncbi:MAG: rhodanese-like domain-containing protein [Pseudomonadota bacterium]
MGEKMDAFAEFSKQRACSGQYTTERSLCMKRSDFSKWITFGMVLPVMLLAIAPAQAAGPQGNAETAAPATRAIKLPERMNAAELKRMLMDLPGTFEIVDVRPPEQFRDFSLPGSINAHIADVITNPAYLNGLVSLIIVDRDGSMAMAVGGILSQKTQRPIKVLYGGLEAYWNDSVAPLAPVAPDSVPVVKPAAPAAAPATAPAAPGAPAPASPEAPKKKSAGC